MKVAEMMSRDVQIADPNDSITQAARTMAMFEIGFLPVGENDKLIGSLTDRDLVVRALADGLPVDAKVRDVMTSDVKYCYEDDEVEDITRNMGQNQVRRLPVVDRDKRLTGIFSIGDAARTDPASAGDGLRGVSQPGGPNAH